MESFSTPESKLLMMGKEGEAPRLTRVFLNSSVKMFVYIWADAPPADTPPSSPQLRRQQVCRLLNLSLDRADSLPIRVQRMVPILYADMLNEYSHLFLDRVPELDESICTTRILNFDKFGGDIVWFGIIGKKYNSFLFGFEWKDPFNNSLAPQGKTVVYFSLHMCCW